MHTLKREAVGNLARWIQLGVATDEARQQFTDGPVTEHTTLKMTGEPQRIRGAVYDAITLTGNAERIGEVSVTWRSYHALPLVELALDWHKAWNELPEAAYVAFPFAVPDARLEFETSGGFFQPGSHAQNGQIPGTCSTYYTIQ